MPGHGDDDWDGGESMVDQAAPAPGRAECCR